MSGILFGAAYYDEYMPEERLAEDVHLMRQAHINTVRIAESTWSTLEPRPGEFDFSSIDRVLAAMHAAGIGVIIGTPTYAVPPWLAKLDPEVLVDTKGGRARYGHRQLMDITNKTFLERAEMVCRRLLAHTAKHPAVIGFQVDNETKHYGVIGDGVQQRFQAYLRERYETVENLNKRFGLAYWSNALGSWDDFPDMRGCVNGNLFCEFERFRRGLVGEYLAWQAALVNEYRRPGQFVTHNFDFEWRKFGAAVAQDGYSYGVQPDVDHYGASRPFDLIGTDIYHPAQDDLTGAEIAFGSDLIRALGQRPYLVLETQAQAFNSWLPFPGQLRLQAYSHLAGGALGVMYWNWHSIHNGFETYWRGVLSHDLRPNATYEEAARIGRELEEVGERIAIKRKRNRAAIVVDNGSLSLLNWFPVHRELSYNDIFRWVYDALYRMNAECDVVFAEALRPGDYDLIILPALYSAEEGLLEKLDGWVRGGGTLVATYKTAVSDERGSVYHDTQPHRLRPCFGMFYNQFTVPGTARLKDVPGEAGRLRYFMELLQANTAEALYTYEHGAWGRYAAVTQNSWGRGRAYYVGCHCSQDILQKVLARALDDAGIDRPSHSWPIILRRGENAAGRQLTFCLNYSPEPAEIDAPCAGGDLLSGTSYSPGEAIALPAWGVAVIEREEGERDDS